MNKLNTQNKSILANLKNDILELTIDSEGIENYVPSIISSDSEQVIAAERVKYVAGIIRRVKELRKTYTKPLDEFKKQIMVIEKDFLSLFQTAELGYKRAIRDYDRNRQSKIDKAKTLAEHNQREEEQKYRMSAENSRKDGTIDGEVEAIEYENQAQKILETPIDLVIDDGPKISKVLLRRHYKSRIVDIGAIPRKYMIPNIAMLDKLAKDACGDNAMAPDGITFVETNS